MTLATYRAGDPRHPHVVLLHGITDSALSWGALMRELKDEYYLVAVDALGHGLSPQATTSDVFGESVDALDALVRDLDRPVIIGHSFGGAQGTALALRTPELLRGLILEDPAWLGPHAAQQYRRKAVKYAAATRERLAHPWETLEALRAEYPTWRALDYAGWWYSKQLGDTEFIEAGVVSGSEDWEADARALSVPTLLITCNGPDTTVGPRGIAAITKLGNPHIDTALIKGASHSIRRDAPEEFTRLVRERLATLTR